MFDDFLVDLGKINIMKKLLFVFVCVLIGCSEERILIDGLTNKVTITTPILYKDGKVFNGICYNIFPNGNIMFEGEFVDSRVDGIFIKRTRTLRYPCKLPATGHG